MADQRSARFDAATLAAAAHAVALAQTFEPTAAFWRAWRDGIARTRDTAPVVVIELARRAASLLREVRGQHPRKASLEAHKALHALSAALPECYVPRVFDYGSRARAVEHVFHARRAVNVFTGEHLRHDAKANLLQTTMRLADDAASSAAYPLHFWGDYRRLRAGDVAGLDTALSFLEADPWFPRVVYTKERLLDTIKRLPLAPDAEARLRQIALHVVDGRDRRDFRHYCRVVARLDTPGFRDALSVRLEHADEGVRRRAGWMLAYLDGHPTPSRRSLTDR